MKLMQKILTISTLLASVPLHAAVFNLAGTFDNSLAVSNLGAGFASGGTISGTLDTDTNTITISVDGPNMGTSLRRPPSTNVSAITIRLLEAPATQINLAVDTDGTNPSDSPLLLALTETMASDSSAPQSSDIGVSISDTLETQIINGQAYLTIDGDDGDTAGQIVATSVPEPSSTLLISLSALGFLSRRKRK